MPSPVAIPPPEAHTVDTVPLPSEDRNGWRGLGALFGISPPLTHAATGVISDQWVPLAGDGSLLVHFTMDAFPHAQRTRRGPSSDYMASTPLSVQMVAYDLERGELVGAPGLPPGILEGALHVNNGTALRRATERDGVTMPEYIAKKNAGINFATDASELPL